MEPKPDYYYLLKKCFLKNNKIIIKIYKDIYIYMVTICPNFTGTLPVFNQVSRCPEKLFWDSDLSRFQNFTR
jgi:hypothetical protein